MTIFTIGHSTRSFDDFVALLRAHGVTQLADVRTVPKSRRHPHFAQESLVRALPDAGIEYRHVRDLGGLRKPRPDSRNTAWRNESFRGYADHMQTPAFARALDELVAWAGGGDPSEDPERLAPPQSQLSGDADTVASQRAGATAIMCAEAVWWQCHRQLIADALVARGIDVRHIMSAASAPAHKLTDFARVDLARVSYPGLL
jgi:uncharacterized protein (DUF488 family)